MKNEELNLPKTDIKVLEEVLKQEIKPNDNLIKAQDRYVKINTLKSVISDINKG